MKNSKFLINLKILGVVLLCTSLVAGCNGQQPAAGTVQPGGAGTIVAATPRQRQSAQPGAATAKAPEGNPAATQPAAQANPAEANQAPDPNQGPTATFIPTAVSLTATPTTSGTAAPTATLAPSSKRIAFTSDTDGDGYADQVNTANADGTDIQTVLDVNEDDVPGYIYDFTPDGSKLIFEQGLPAQIYTLQIDNKTITAIPNQPEDENFQPSLSPDGKWIVFVNIFDGQTDLYLIRPDGTGLFRLTNDDNDEANPRWSPDGKKIVFTEEQDGDQDIYTLDVSEIVKTTSGDPTASAPSLNLVANTPEDEETPIFLSDNKTIVFAQSLDGQWDLLSINSDTKEIRKLTDTDDNEQQPYISNDGKQIIFISDRDEQGEVYRMNIDGSSVSRLTKDGTLKFFPAWAH
jgi:TolB protein